MVLRIRRGHRRLNFIADADIVALHILVTRRYVTILYSQEFITNIENLLYLSGDLTTLNSCRASNRCDQTGAFVLKDCALIICQEL